MKILDFIKLLPNCSYFYFEKEEEKIYWKNAKKESKWTDFSELPEDVITAIKKSDLLYAELVRLGWLCTFAYGEYTDQWEDVLVSDETSNDLEL